ncbi:hypothetical protein BC835DRAFT_1406039 [Cytidiella melzeri]|nr:hypothetical protein BC835DRAFT_1406039 [Cytidiella melzeri]
MWKQTHPPISLWLIALRMQSLRLPGVRKKKERTHESFIVVRPPPSKSNHPLNLQVQLVPPSSRSPLPRTSFSSAAPFSSASEPGDSESFTPETPLTRTTSNRSDVSAYSAVTSLSTASTTSFSSIASTSTSSTSGGRRMIIPLYNLQAHNVMTNVIVDAGTDAKIAKFLKRGLEVIGLAMLEVVETTRGMDWADDRQGHAQQAALLSAEGHTPTSSHVSLNSDNAHDSPPAPDQQSPLVAAQSTPQSEKSGARRLFGKVFKKRSDSSPAASPTMNYSPYLHSPTPRSPLPSHDRDPSSSSQPRGTNKRSSLLLSAGVHTQTASEPLGSPATAQQQQQQQQQTILGIAPILHTPYSSPDGSRVRPTRYVWVVRKWLKGPPSGVTLPSGSILPGHSALDGLVEVSFEWLRATPKRKDSRLVKSKSRGSKERQETRQESGSVPSESPSLTSLRRGRKSVDGERESGARGRTRSRESVHTTHTTTTERGDEDDEDSDPEDSETPWMCQLVVRKLQEPSLNRLSFISSDDGNAPASASIKVKVAAVVPAPHHPKVVSLLKVPFPLQDIVITSKSFQTDHRHGHLSPHFRPTHGREFEIDVEARKRIVTPQGVARPATAVPTSPPATPTQAAVSASGSGAGLQKLAGKFLANASLNGSASPSASNSETSGILLSAEEIKDIVCCTALWVVVRESFGGVGRERRKGDGWRIRG